MSLSLKIKTRDLDAGKQKQFKEHFKQYIDLYMENNPVYPSDQPHEGVSGFLKHIKEVYNLLVKAFGLGCLEITVQCPTLGSLESLWSDYCAGHLNEVAERFLVTSELKRKLNVENVRLETTISEENYLMCKKSIIETSRKFLKINYQSFQTIKGLEFLPFCKSPPFRGLGSNSLKTFYSKSTSKTLPQNLTI